MKERKKNMTQRPTTSKLFCFQRLLKPCGFFVFMFGLLLGGLDSTNLFAQLDQANAVVALPQAVDQPTVPSVEFLGVPLFDDDFYKLHLQHLVIHHFPEPG